MDDETRGKLWSLRGDGVRSEVRVSARANKKSDISAEQMRAFLTVVLLKSHQSIHCRISIASQHGPFQSAETARA